MTAFYKRKGQNLISMFTVGHLRIIWVYAVYVEQACGFLKTVIIHDLSMWEWKQEI
jgi:hypothetical protein